VHSPSLDVPLFRRLLESLALSLSEDSESQESISSLMELLEAVDAGAAVRSPLQIELILRSLNPSSAKLLGRALR